MEDYQREGRRLANAFLAGQGMGGTSLDTLIEKTSRDQGLLPEQIRRLSRATNTEMFSLKYASMKGAQDRRVDFDPVDGDALIRKLQSVAPPTAPVAEKTAALYPDIRNHRRAHFAPFEKQASFVPPVHTVSPEIRWRHLKKIASDLPVELMQLDIQWQSLTKDVAASCNNDTFDHDAFEKNAVAVLGSSVLAELNAVRAALRLPESSLSQDKVASLEDRLVGHPDKLTAKLASAMSARTAYSQKAEAFRIAQEDLRAVDAEVRRVG